VGRQNIIATPKVNFPNKEEILFITSFVLLVFAAKIINNVEHAKHLRQKVV
jgi:hypothetical protein